MENIVIIIILITIVISIICFLARSKKHGEICIGCPYSKQCRDKCGNNCDCSNSSPSKDIICD